MVVYQSQNDIYAPVERDLQRVVTNLSAVWESQEDQHSGVAERLAHVLATPGKRVRPAVTLLASRLWGREPDERTIKMATAVELLHIATLIHDDTIDMADTRRGFATASNLWGGSMAVLSRRLRLRLLRHVRVRHSQRPAHSTLRRDNL